MKAAYGRVSSREQAENSHALEQQLARLQRHGYDRLFCDVQSGTEDNRPQFQELLTELEAGRVTDLVVTRIDRILRDAEMNFRVIRAIAAKRIQFYILDKDTRPQDPTNPYTWRELASDGVAAQFESMMLSLRVRRGVEHAREKLRPPAAIPFGYCRKGDRYALSQEPFGGAGLTVAEVAREMVEVFLRVRVLRIACQEIRDRHGKTWDASAFRKWLNNPVLQGHTSYLRVQKRKTLEKVGHRDPIIHYSTHPDDVLISPSEARAIARIMADNRSLRGRNQNARDLPLRGLVFCGECGSRCVFHGRKKPSGKQYWYFYCSDSRGGIRQCKQKTVSVPMVEEAVIEVLTSRAGAIAAEIELELETGDILDPEQVRLEQKLAELQGIASRFGGSTHLDEAIAETERAIADRQAQKQTREQLDQEAREALQKYGDRELWERMELRHRQELYCWFVQRVVVRDGVVVTIELKA